MKVLLYCNKSKPYLYHDEDYCLDTMNTIDLGYKTFEYTNQRVYDDKTGKFLGWEKYGYMYKNNSLNGKIVAECDFEVKEIRCEETSEEYWYVYDSDYSNHTWMEETCLPIEKIDKYLNGKNGYAINIKNLHIFDKPKELSEYYNNKELMRDILEIWENYGLPDKDDYDECLIKKAPQNMCRVFDEKNDYILISIRPEHLCKILNREQTILVRKKVLKEMLKNGMEIN